MKRSSIFRFELSTIWFVMAVNQTKPFNDPSCVRLPECNDWQHTALRCIQVYTEKIHKRKTILNLFTKNTVNGDKRDKWDHATLKTFANPSKENNKVKRSLCHGGPEMGLT